MRPEREGLSKLRVNKSFAYKIAGSFGKLGLSVRIEICHRAKGTMNRAPTRW
jgi:hypothetical protein